MRKRHHRYAVAKVRAWRAVIGQSASAILDHPASHVVQHAGCSDLFIC